MKKFHKTVASILAVLMIITSANFAVLAAEDAKEAKQSETVVLSASDDASGSTAGILDGINIDWENYVTESTGTKLTRDYTLGLTDDYLYDSMPTESTEERFNKMRTQLPEEVPVFAPYTKAEIAASAVKFYVAPDGSDFNEGSIEKPFKTFERAVRAVNKLKSKKGGVTVYFREGVYSIFSAVKLTSMSSGASEKDLVFYSNYGDEQVIFSSAISVTGSQLQKANDEVFNRKVQASAKPYIYSIDLKALGYTDFGTWTKTKRPSLYVDGALYDLARWPNGDNTNMAEYKGPGAVAGVVSQGGPNDSEGIAFQFANPRPLKWENTDNIWIYGYFYAEYNREHFRIKDIDPEKMIIRSYDTNSWRISFQRTKTYYYYNILEELDMPGEWHLDNKTGMLYLYPAVEIKDDTLIQVVTSTNDIINLKDTKYSVINGITFNMASTGVKFDLGSERNIIQRCTFKNVTANTVNFGKSVHNGVICSYLLGKTLLSGLPFKESQKISANFIQNCFTKGIEIREGDRNVFSHNVVCAFDKMGISMYLDGADRILEYNEFVAGPDVNLDAGLIYNNGSPRSAGHVIRYNFINKATPVMRNSPYGIYLDDRTEGHYVYGNILREARIFLHADSDNAVYNNLICDTGMDKNSLSNSDHYGNETTGSQSWETLVSRTIRFAKGYTDYYSRTWQSRYPYMFEWHSKMIQNTYDREHDENYDPYSDLEGIYLSSPKRNVYKNNVFANATYDLSVSKREIMAVDKNNYVFKDPSVLNFEDYENGVFNPDPDKIAELCPGVEPFKSITQMGVIYDPALIPETIELEALVPLSPMDSEEVKVMPTGVIIKWNEVYGKSSYNVKVAKDPEFKDLIYEKETQAEEVALPELDYGQQYYWTVSTNQWSQKFSQVPSVMKTATFITYSYDEAAALADLEYYELESYMEEAAAFIESGFIIEEGTPEAENYPSDLPLYKAGTKERLYEFIEQSREEVKKCRVQEEVDNYTKKWTGAFYAELTKNGYDYVVNIGTGSHMLTADTISNTSANITAEYLGNAIKLTSKAQGTVGNLVPVITGNATLAMSVKYEFLNGYAGINFWAPKQVSGSFTANNGYGLVIKSDLIELQRRPYVTGESSIFVEVVNDSKIVKEGEWFDLTMQVIPTADGNRIIVKIDGNTIIDYLDKNAPTVCYGVAYYGLMSYPTYGVSEFASIRNAELVDIKLIRTKELESVLTEAESLESGMIESDTSAGEVLTYKTGTKAKLKAVIDAAKAVLGADSTVSQIEKATEDINAVLADVKKNDANEYTHVISELDLSLWESTSPLAAVNLSGDGKTITITPAADNSASLVYKKPVTSRQTMKLKVSYDNIANWHAICTRLIDPKATPTNSRGYFFVIKNDLIEFQKYTDKGEGVILASVPNNGMFAPKNINEIEVGSVNVDGGVLSTLKLGDSTVLKYLDQDDPIYEEGYFAVFAHHTLGPVSISTISK
ncbi:MAG: right-handed parallel beta-helix repeat-containing protein [Clostridia bacterium]|nr:right-handed parallel beta-helix repeat-containing protein [Clostridia bacterium]